ncbi:hypothetical protein AGMMS49940_13140 [Spirochaetia bacterium]|nr:hypothetical protein AGMMS49940_13140 [Spirochaetia bacterium]
MFKRYNSVMFWGALALLLLAGMAGCNQDDIFYTISTEVPPTDPLIKGSPSKIVQYGSNLYVVNGKIFECAPGGRWHGFGGPGGYVVDVASTSGALYALTINNTSTAVWKNTGSGGWTSLGNGSGYGFIQNIYGAGAQLFATGAVGDGGGGYNYAILYENSLDSFTLLQETGKALLSGAGELSPTYYLGTTGNGIYPVSSGFVVDPPVTISTDIKGLLKTKIGSTDFIIAASKNGMILYSTGSGFTEWSPGGTFTGALTVTKAFNNGSFNGTEMLLIGIQGSSTSYSHGYQEVTVTESGGTINFGSLTDPGGSTSSIKPDGNYSSSLKRYPVTALWAEPSHSVIFAATSNEGLYSYRSRNGVWQWNYEED